MKTVTVSVTAEDIAAGGGTERAIGRAVSRVVAPETVVDVGPWCGSLSREGTGRSIAFRTPSVPFRTPFAFEIKVATRFLP